MDLKDFVGRGFIRGRWDGPTGKGYPPSFERTDPWPHYLPAQPARRFTIQVPTQANATWNRLELTAPSIMRLRNPPSGASPAGGVETIELHIAQEGELPVSVNQGLPCYGNLAVMGSPGTWYWGIFANVACRLDAEIWDISNSDVAQALLNCPRAHNALVIADAATGAAADIVLLAANNMPERRKVLISNTMNVTARINFGAPATATLGIPLMSGVAGVPSSLLLDATQLPLYSIHAFGTGAGTVLSVAVWT